MSINPLIVSSINSLGKNVQKPNNKRNYTLYDKNKVENIARYGSRAIPYIENYLNGERSEAQIFEALCVIDKMADYKVSELYKIYPVLSKYNDTKSAMLQVMLAGIYRKILVPDAFGPLCKMLHNQITSNEKLPFDPTEEIGGAILEYIRNYGVVNNPAQFPAKPRFNIIA